MRTKAMTAGMFALVLAAIAGCARGDAANAREATEVASVTGKTSTHSFAYAGAAASASSHVERQVRADGSETLLGTTEITAAGAAHPLVLVETAELDAAGRLTGATAELSAGPQAREQVRSVRLDATRGVVTVRDAAGESSWLVALDGAWIYEDLFADIAPRVASVTAVQAWVAKRAAEGGSRLRVVDVAEQRSHLTLPDQVLFTEDNGALVVIGDEAVETDSDFVRALPWKALVSAPLEPHAADYCVPGPA